MDIKKVTGVYFSPEEKHQETEEYDLYDPYG